MANNSQSAGESCFMTIIVIIYLVLCPFLMTIMALTSAYNPIIISYLVVMVFMICCFSFIPDKVMKYIVAGLAALIFAVIFCSWYSTYELKGDYSDGGLGDLLCFFFCSFSLMAPCHLLGTYIEKTIHKMKIQKSEFKNGKICDKILELKKANEELSRKITNHKTELKLINLIEECGGDIDSIAANKRFSEIIDIEESISNNNNRIEKLKKMLDVIEY